MLDLIFLAVGIYAFVKAMHGEYKETACNIALVTGILAGALGCVYAIAKGDGQFLWLNMIVMVLAFALRFAARHLVKMYIDKQVAETEAREKDEYLHAKFRDPNAITGYTDENFEDEDLRFGKGGWTDPKI